MIQLEYFYIDIDLALRDLERVMGIEPTFEAWEAPVLPLNYTRKMAVVREFTTVSSRESPPDGKPQSAAGKLQRNNITRGSAHPGNTDIFPGIGPSRPGT